MSDKRKLRGCGAVNPHLALTRPSLPRRERIEARVGACASPERFIYFAGRFHG
jgi:hypothetical protein